jgi:protein translocase SecG subunit
MSVLPFIQIALSLLIIVSVLIQQSSAGLGALSGSESTVTLHTRRGFEKFIFMGTIVFSVLFALGALIQVIY